MKRRLLSAFLAVMMVLTMAPVAFAADGNATLQSKIDEAANGSTVTLDKDYTENIIIKSSKNITLDLGSNTLTNNGGDTITVEQGATLTIEGNGTVDNVTNSKTTVYNKGTVVLNGGTYKRSKEDGVDANNAGTNTFYTVLNHGKMTINGGVTIKNKGHHSSMLENGYYDGYAASLDGVQKPEMVINSGTFDGGLNTVKNDDNASLTINDGNFSNYTQAAFQNHHMATINGGTFNAENVDAVINCGNASCTSTNEEHGKHFTQITGGIFNGGVMRSIGNIEITGGAFTADVSAYVAKGYKSVELNGKNIVVVDTADTAVAELSDYKFTNVQNAIDAATDNDTVKLLSNVSEDITIADKVITLDMDGKSLTLPSDCGVSVVGASSKLTITGNGVMNCEKTPIAVSEGTVVIENGTITSAKDYCTYAKNGGTIIVNDGILTSQYAVLTGNNTTGNMNFIVNGGTLTAKGGPAIYQSGQCKLTITGGTLNGGISLRMGQVNISGGTINAATENLDMPGNNVSGTNTPGYAYSGNVWFPDALYVIGGTYTSKDSTYSNSLNLNITGGTFNCTNGQGSAVAIYDLGHTAQAEKITISGDAKFATNCTTRGAYQVVDFEDLGVKPITGYGKTDLVGKVSTAISAGTFSSDVTKYCVKGMMAKAQDDGTYEVVPIPENTITDVKANVSTGTATAKTDKITDETSRAAAAAAANSAVPTVSEKDAAAKELTKEEKGDALNALLSNPSSGIKLDANGKVVASDGSTTKVDVTVTKVIYLDIEVNAYDAENHTVAMDVTPKYNVVAKTSAMGDGATPIVVSTDNALTVTEPTTVTLKLAKSFFGNDVTNPVAYVRHTKDNKVYVYNTKITPDDTDTTKYKVEFVTPHGFSPMTITTVAPVAKIGDVGYTSLTDAVASAANGDTIKLLANCDDEITISKNVTIECGAFKADKVAAGSGYTKSVSGTTITIAKKSSGGSSGSSSGKTTYKVTTSAVNNGGVNASPSSAEKGAAITITLSPDKGYKLDKLTVTDGSGKSVSTVKKSDTVYTFTMPASAVNVGVSYVKATETPSKTKFNDVSANDWFASAVDYVTGKGMMNGTADNTFSPKANTTRGMLMTVLARHAGEDTTGGSVWYEKGMNWAKANGVSDGTNPQVNITREQLAAMLYRYAQNKKYDVSGAKSLDGYTDAQSVSSYAVPALQWACGAGVMNGKSGSKLDPKGYATRAEVAAMLMRFCENVK